MPQSAETQRPSFTYDYQFGESDMPVMTFPVSNRNMSDDVILDEVIQIGEPDITPTIEPAIPVAEPFAPKVTVVKSADGFIFNGNLMRSTASAAEPKPKTTRLVTVEPTALGVVDSSTVQTDKKGRLARAAERITNAKSKLSELALGAYVKGSTNIQQSNANVWISDEEKGKRRRTVVGALGFAAVYGPRIFLAYKGMGHHGGGNQDTAHTIHSAFVHDAPKAPSHHDKDLASAFAPEKPKHTDHAQTAAHHLSSKPAHHHAASHKELVNDFTHGGNAAAHHTETPVVSSTKPNTHVHTYSTLSHSGDTLWGNTENSVQTAHPHMSHAQIQRLTAEHVQHIMELNDMDEEDAEKAPVGFKYRTK
jgi:hypothetical protein